MANWLDLLGWMGTNVVIGMFAPAIGMKVMREFNGMIANL